MADFLKMLQQAQQVQTRLQQLQDELKSKTVSASSGGGMVTVTADGQGTLRTLKLDPTVVSPNEVQKKAAELAQEEMRRATGGMSLPFKMPF
jgi:DNA-binding YbaB/EbfC family protein